MIERFGSAESAPSAPGKTSMVTKIADEVFQVVGEVLGSIADPADLFQKPDPKRVW